MRFRKVVLSTVFFLLTTLILSSSSAQEKCVEITGNVVNIRFSSSTSSAIVSKARKGDLFKLGAEESQWYRIVMFSGEYRCVHKSLARLRQCAISLPSQVSTRRKIFTALLEEEDRAQAEADQKYPHDWEKNTDYMRLLNDRYKLAVMHRFGLQPLAYKKIIAEGVKKKWY